jgi:hypothetical protein
MRRSRTEAELLAESIEILSPFAGSLEETIEAAKKAQYGWVSVRGSPGYVIILEAMHRDVSERIADAHQQLAKRQPWRAEYKNPSL